MPARTLRTLLGAVLLIALLTATPSARAAWRPAVRAAVRYIHTRSGQVSFAVRTDGRLWGYKRTRGAHSASVVKALLLVAYLDDPRVRS